jgi:hypothetical protein
MTSKVFLHQLRLWTAQMRQIASEHPGTGACTVATALQMWQWTLNHLQEARDAEGNLLYQGQRQGVTFALADALCWALSARSLILDVIELQQRGPENPVLAEGLEGLVQFYSDLCHVHSARAAGEVGRICAELVHGYNRHPAWDNRGCGTCFEATELDQLEGFIPGIAGSAGVDVLVEAKHPVKAGPCACTKGVETFTRLRTKMDSCLTGARLAKDRAALALTQVMIPEALDYPA